MHFYILLFIKISSYNVSVCLGEAEGVASWPSVFGCISGCISEISLDVSEPTKCERDDSSCLVLFLLIGVRHYIDRVKKGFLFI